MKKKILVLLFALLWIPFVVFADGETNTTTTNNTTTNNSQAAATTCQSDKVTVEKIIFKEKTGNAKELSYATVNQNKITLNLEMGSVGDQIVYEITVKNDANEDFEFDGKNLGINGDYIAYTLASSDNSNIIKKGTSKVFRLTVKYKAEVPTTLLSGGSYTETKDIVYVVSDELTPASNPKTGDSRGIFTLICFIVGFGFIYLIINKSRYSKMLVLLLALTVIPLTIYAICRCEITLNSKVVITPVATTPEGGTGGEGGETPDPGTGGGNTEPTEINAPGGTLGVDPDNTSKVFGRFNIDKSKIEEVVITNYAAPAQGVNVVYPGYDVVSEANIPTYLAGKVPTGATNVNDASAAGDGTVLLFTIDSDGDNKLELHVIAYGSIKLPANSSNVFRNFTAATSISGLEFLDTSEVTNMQYFFANCHSVTDLMLISFDTTNVTDVSHMFDNCYALRTIYSTTMATTVQASNGTIAIVAVPAFNTENIEHSDDMFNNCNNLVGENGTTYDSTHKDDFVYARIDKENEPGYFFEYMHLNWATTSNSPS